MNFKLTLKETTSVNLKKKQKRSITLAAIAVIAIALVIGYNYSAEQTRIKGFNFGNDLQQIQEDLKNLQDEFEANLSMYKDGKMTREEFLVFAPTHVKRMEELISRYDELSPPTAFGTSVDLLQISTESQLEGEKLLISWVDTGNEADRIRADEIHQEALEFELAGIASFNDAKAGNTP